MHSDPVRVAALEALLLGGVGEFGMNMMAVRCGGTGLLVDAGVMFPGPERFGVDLVIPDIAELCGGVTPINATVLTHGHEDHIGAVPYVWDLIHGPIYGSALTLAMLDAKLRAHGVDPDGRLVTVAPGQTVTVGALRVEFIRVAHSMPDCLAVAIQTPLGVLVHTGDFKFDLTPPDREPVDVHRLAEIGSAGVLALFADSTNAERPGHTGSELDVVPALEKIFASATRLLIVATFASSLHRIQLLVDLATRFQRRVAFVGRGVKDTSDIAGRVGRLRVPDGARIREADIPHADPATVLCIVTGSQGEPLSALARIAADAHRHVSLGPGDVVVFSARTIPGNERAIGRVMNNVVRRGAGVIDEATARVHVSGHASEEDLKLMLSLVRPRYFVPIHGEYRHLAHHARLAEHVSGGASTPLVGENGHRVCFDADGGWIDLPAPAGRVRLDGTRRGTVSDDVLRDRRHLAGDGVVVAVVTMRGQTGRLERAPELIPRGLVLDDTTRSLLDDAIPTLIKDLLATVTAEERADRELIGERVRAEMQRCFRKHTGRRPMIVPVIMEM